MIVPDVERWRVVATPSGPITIDTTWVCRIETDVPVEPTQDYGITEAI